MKKILVLGRVYPYLPATGGDMSYSRGLITSIGREAEVTVVVASNGEQADGVHQCNGVTWVIAGQQKFGRVGSVFSLLPNIAWRGDTHAYRVAVNSALSRDWDAIVLDNVGVAHSLGRVVRYRTENPTTKIVYISHEHEASVRKEKYAAYGGNPLLKLAMKLDGSKVTSAELRLIKSVDLLTVINPEDEARYRKQVTGLNFVTMTPGYSGGVVASRTIDDNVSRRVVVLGGRGPKQKQVILQRWLEAASTIFHQNNIEMLVVGPIDDALGQHLAERYPTTRFLGYVDDIEALLATCRIGIVADFIGGGFKVRLLTYVFNRVPMFSLRGAISGLGVDSQSAYTESEDLEALATSIQKNIDNFTLLNDLQHNAFNACNSRFAWADRGREFIRTLDALQV